VAQVVGGTLIRALRRREQQLFLASATIVLAIFALAPLVQLLAQAATSWPEGFVPLGAARTWALLFRSIALAGAACIIAVLIGLPTGVLFGRFDVPFRRALWLAHAFPIFLPPFLPALGWFHWFGSQGLAGNELTARILFSELGLVLVLGATFAPIVASLTALGVMGIDASLEEAARLVAGPGRVATRILIPAATPAIALGVVVVFALALSELAVPMLLRVDVFPAAVFARLGGVDFAPGEAVALALPLVPIALILLAVERRFAGARSFAVLGLRGGGRAPMPLRGARAAATLACAAAVMLSLAPQAALVVRSGGSLGNALPWVRDAPLNGLAAGVAAATVVTALGIVVGHAAVRRLPGGALLDSLCMLLLVTPAAVLGAGITSLWNHPSTQLVYGTLAILVVGYVARYAVVGARVVAAVVAQTPLYFEEAAAAQGARFGRRLLWIVLPMHRRGVVFAWLLTLVFCLRDLETAILFYPPGREPLTVRIFTLEANGPPAVVAGLAVIQIALTAGVIALAMLLFERRAA
jgi:iron(III) transport system permease protein